MLQSKMSRMLSGIRTEGVWLPMGLAEASFPSYLGPGPGDARHVEKEWAQAACIFTLRTERQQSSAAV